MPFWACAQLVPHRERLALHCLSLAGYETYRPLLRQYRMSHGRRIETSPALFPGYCFITIVAQWHAARWAPGVARIVLDGAAPARVPDGVIAEIRSRERIRPADAIQLACAAAAKTDLFVTNDNRLAGVVVPGITFVTGIERIPY